MSTISPTLNAKSTLATETWPSMGLRVPQIEAVKLAAESQRKHLEATLANAKRDAAQAATSQKTAAAVWHGELDFQKAEVRQPLLITHPVATLPEMP